LFEKYFCDCFYNRLTSTYKSKKINHGDYLVDGRITNDAGEFKCELIQIEIDKFQDCKRVVSYLLD